VAQPRHTWFPKNSVFQSISFTPISDNTWQWDRFRDGKEPDEIKLNSSTTMVLRGGWNTTVYHWSETFKYDPALFTNYFVERHNSTTGAVIDTVPFVGTDRLTNLGLDLRLATPQWSKFSGSIDFLGGQDDNFDEWSSAIIYYTTV